MERQPSVEMLGTEELMELYDFPPEFHDRGLAPARQKDGKWLHIRPDGIPAYEERYERVGGFHEDYAWVVDKGKWFHIGLDFKPAYEERYDEASDFSGSLATVSKDGEAFFIVPDGRQVR